MKANLHTHTFISDGAKSVNQTIEELNTHGFTLIAKTDHDTVKCDMQAKSACEKLNIKYISGVEITSYCKKGLVDDVGKALVFHILGLGINPEKMEKELSRIELKKEDCIFELADRLIEDGYNINKDCLFNTSNGKVYKKTLAQELVRCGYADKVTDAYENILNLDKYIDLSKYPLTADAIKAIKNAEGYAIWAHPFNILGDSSRRLTENEIELLASELKSEGLDGLEVYYLQFSEDKIQALEKIANKFRLLKSIGTDYHGIDGYDSLLLSNNKMEEYTEKAKDLINKLI